MPTATEDLASLVNKATEGLDRDLRTVAFGRILDHLLANRTDGRAGAKSDAANSRADDILGSEQQRVDALARYFKIAPEDVSHVFDASDDTPRLTIPSGHLSKAKAPATREIALLVGGALTALGIDITTAHIRQVADDYGRLEGKNFMATLTCLDEISVLGRPESTNRVIRMKVIGAEKARALVGRIAASTTPK